MKLENINESKNREGEFNFEKIFYILVHQWHWFLLFGALGFGCAYIYTLISDPRFRVSASVLVTEKSNEIDIKNIFKSTPYQLEKNIYNQIEMIKLYSPVYTALSNLDWRTSWYKKEHVVWRSIYKEEPFDVQEDQNFINPKGIALCITPTSNNSYKVSVNGEIRKKKSITKINFEGEGTFGRPFKNGLFNFTLHKKAKNSEATEGMYKFVFNDLNDATLAYQKKLNVVLQAKKGDIIQCTLEGEEPVKYGEFLNELIKVYVEDKLNLQNEVHRRSLDFINSQLSGISDSMNTAGTKYTDFRSKNEIINLDSETTIVMNNLKEIQCLFQIFEVRILP